MDYSILMYSKFKNILFCVVLIFFGSEAFGQLSINSPYSRYGIGEFSSAVFVAQRSLGGIAAGYSDPYSINLQNPASLGYLQNTALDIGFDARFSRLNGPNSTDDFWGGNMTYLSLAFPIINPLNRVLENRSSDFNWGMTLSIVPFSKVGYQTYSIFESEDFGTAQRQIEGKGGTNKVLFGNGWKYKDFTFGLNLGYLFGAVTSEQAIFFEDFVLGYHNYSRDEDSYRAFVYDLGAQYRFVLKEGQDNDAASTNTLTVGIYGHGGLNFSIKQNFFDARIRTSVTYMGLGSNLRNELGVDTLALQEGVKTKGKLPASFGFGAVYKAGDRLLVGADLQFEGWSNFENDAFRQDSWSYENRTLLSAGLEYTPDPNSFTSFFKRVKYRTGIQLGTDPRSINGNQISRFNWMGGIGLPIVVARQISFVNIGVEYGSLGGEIAVKENILTFSVGVTFNNNLWFYKRKYD